MELKMPHDILAERAVLASVIEDAQFNPTASSLSEEMFLTLTESDFHDASHRVIYGVIKKVRSKGIAPDMVTVGLEIPSNDQNANSSFAILTSTATTVSKSGFKSIMERVKSFSRSRAIIAGAYQAIATLSAENVDGTELERAEAILSSAITDTRADVTRGGYTKSLMTNYMKNKADIASGRIEKGMTTGIASFDTATGGLKRGELLVIGGISGMGKTSMAMTLLAHFIITKRHSAVFSLEMVNDDCIDKTSSVLSRKRLITVPYQIFRNPEYLSSNSYSDYAQQVWREVADADIYLNDDPNMPTDRIRSLARRLNADKQLDFVFVDHALLTVQDSKREREELTYFSNAMKSLAKELNCCVVVLSQLNYREGKDVRPHKGMLKGSGSLGEAADIIWFPWRPYALTNQGDPSEATLIIGKGRGFLDHDIPMEFCTKTTGYYEREHGYTHSQPEQPQF